MKNNNANVARMKLKLYICISFKTNNTMTTITVTTKLKDSEGNIFTITEVTRKSVSLKSSAGEKEIAKSDLKFYEKISSL